MRRTTKRAVVALDLIAFTIPGLVSFTRGIGKGLTNNANLTAADLAKLPVTVADLLASADTLEGTHTARLTAPSRTATKTELDQAGKVADHLTDTAAFIEGLANTRAAGDVNLAGAIIVSVGFGLKKHGVKPKKGFKAASTNKGAASVHVPPGSRNAVRLLQYSVDGGKTYSTPIVVHGVDVILTGFKSGVEVLFRMATSTPPAKRTKATIVVGTEEPAWGDTVSCVIS